MRRSATVLAVLFLTVAAPAAAQVHGSCVANCGSPAPRPPPPPPPPPDPSREVFFTSVRSSGEVRLERAGGGVLIGQNMAQVRLTSGDKLVTGPGGDVDLTLSDGSLIHLDAGTEVAFDDIRWLSEPSPVLIRLVVGGLRLVTSKLPHNEPRVGLFGLVGGIRGTAIDMRADPDGSGSLTLVEGAIEITTDGGESFAMSPGQTITFSNFALVGQR